MLTRNIAWGFAAVMTVALLGAACAPSGGAPKPASAPTVAPATKGGAAPSGGGDAAKGKDLITSKGCGGCHVIQGIPGAVGTVGPNLSKVGSAPRLAGVLDNNPANMKKWLQDPPAAKPGTLMAKLPLTDQELNDLVAYLETLK